MMGNPAKNLTPVPAKKRKYVKYVVREMIRAMSG
jgi:hypothetical protein